MTEDIFDNQILCKNCNLKMQKVQFLKNGFTFRAVQCAKCGNKIIHPEDKLEYERYVNLRNKHYAVKLRMVGNSYTVSIPREIVNFINEQNKIIDEIVRLNFDRMGRISLMFNDIDEKELEEEKHERER